jgi:hypothetical protein
MRFFTKKIKKRFGDSILKHLSLHPLLTSTCSKNDGNCEESFLRIQRFLLSLQSAKNGRLEQSSLKILK